MGKKKRRKSRWYALPTMVVYSPRRSQFWKGPDDEWSDIDDEQCHCEYTRETLDMCPLPEEEGIVFMTLKRAREMLERQESHLYLTYAHSCRVDALDGSPAA